MIRIDVSLLGQTFTLSCRKDEVDALREAVDYLNKKMNAIRDSGRVRGNDRIAITAAIAIAAELLQANTELLQLKTTQKPFQDMSPAEIRQKLTDMNAVLDKALAPQENLF